MTGNNGAPSLIAPKRHIDRGQETADQQGSAGVHDEIGS
jgi:hypothetical protein